MIKLKTGTSTGLDFIRAMKERGQNVSPKLPAATLRDQLDALSDDVKVTFKSDNETVLQVINDYEPATDKVTVTIDLNGGSIEDPSLLTIEMDKGSSFVKQTWLEEAEMAGLQPSGSSLDEYDDLTYEKDNAETKVEDSIVVEEDITLYVLWRNMFEITLINMDDETSQTTLEALNNFDPSYIHETLFEAAPGSGGYSIGIKTANVEDSGMCNYTSENSATLNLNEGDFEVAAEQDPETEEWTTIIQQHAMLTLNYDPCGFNIDPETELPTEYMQIIDTYIGEEYTFIDPESVVDYMEPGLVFDYWEYNGQEYRVGDTVTISDVESSATVYWREDIVEEGE